MNKYTIMFGLFLVICTSVFGEEPPEECWVAYYEGASIRALTVDNSGNVYVTGYIWSSSNNSYDCITVKYGPKGNPIWVNNYNGPGNNYDGASALAIDSSGNVYVTGSSTTSNTKSDYATIKYSPDGHQLWVARYNGPENDYDNARAIAIDSSDNIYVTGTSQYDFVTIKYGHDGTQLWVARHGPANTYDEAKAIAIDNSGNIYVTGSEGNGSDSNYATIKYSPNGTQLWVARYNGPGNKRDSASDMAVDSSGNIYVTGTSDGNGTGDDYATIKYDPDGNQLWVARYNSSFCDTGSAIAIDNAGNVYVTGESESNDLISYDYATVKYSANGNQLWVARYNGPGNDNDYPYDIGLDSSGNVYVTGESLGIGTGQDYATVKYDTDGNQLWVARYNGLASGGSEDQSRALAIDRFYNIYVTGSSNGGCRTIKYTPQGLCTCTGDNLGNHTATQNIKLNGHWLSGDGDNEGVYVANTGNVGIGTKSPGHKLMVGGDVYVDGNVLLSPPGFQGAASIQAYKPLPPSWPPSRPKPIEPGILPDEKIGLSFFTTTTIFEVLGVPLSGGAVNARPHAERIERVRITPSGYVGINTTNPQGTLDVNGQIFQRGEKLHADYVFEPSYKLETIEQHSASMWQDKRLPAMPKTVVNDDGQDIVEVGAHQKGIVEELEKAHIYIEQLNHKNQQLEARLAKLEEIIKNKNEIEKPIH